MNRRPGIAAGAMGALLLTAALEAGAGRPDANLHTANENLRLKNLWDGIDTYAAMLADLDW